MLGPSPTDQRDRPGWVPPPSLRGDPSGSWPGPRLPDAPATTLSQRNPPTAGPAKVEPDATRRYLHLTPIAWALLALAALSGAFWLAGESKPQLAIAIALASVVAIDALLARRALTGLTLRLRGPDDASAGQPTEWQVGVEGVCRPVSLVPAMLPRPRPVGIEADTVGRVTMAPFVVGVVHHLVFDLFSSGPVGLVHAAARQRVAPDAPVCVGPRVEPFEIDWPRPRAVSFGLSETAPRGDDLFRSVRPYVRGDERRRIHWKATARHGELMVRESDGTGVVALQVVLELDRPGPGSERVAGHAAWVVGEALAKGWLVQLVTLDAQPVPRHLLELGTPYGLPPVFAPGAVVPVQVRAEGVSGPMALNRQLATVACGPVQRPSWSGLTCVVSERGLAWP